MLQGFAAKHDLTFDRFCSVGLFIQVHLTVHSAHINSDLQVGENLAKLGEVAIDKLQDALAHDICCRQVILLLVLRLRLSLPIHLLLRNLASSKRIFAIELLVKLLCCFKEKLLVMLVIQRDQDEFNLLKEAPSKKGLCRQDEFKVLHISLECFLKEAACKWELIDY